MKGLSFIRINLEPYMQSRYYSLNLLKTHSAFKS